MVHYAPSSHDDRRIAWNFKRHWALRKSHVLVYWWIFRGKNPLYNMRPSSFIFYISKTPGGPPLTTTCHWSKQRSTKVFGGARVRVCHASFLEAEMSRSNHSRPQVAADVRNKPSLLCLTMGVWQTAAAAAAGCGSRWMRLTVFWNRVRHSVRSSIDHRPSQLTACQNLNKS